MNNIYKIIFAIGFGLFFFQAQSQRNVILIIADDIGTDYFGFYEDAGDTVAVPNIRALLNRGVRFMNGMTNPVCSATRSTILTGQYGFRTGVGNIVGGGGGSGQLDTSEITIPRMLEVFNPNIGKANIGKWHLHQPTPASNLLNPLVLGYDHFEGPFIGAINSYTNWTKYTNGVASTVTNYATSENVNNALSWINNQNSNPFFLWLAFNAPHSPIHLPPANLHSYSSLSGTQSDIATNPKPYFKAMMQALDTEIGRLFDSLQVLGRLDSTDIIFIGDNGNTTRTAQIADTSKAKGTIYQYGVHTPFIIAGPSVTNPGRVSDALVNTADIFATVLEMFGFNNWENSIPINKPVDSKSIMPILKDQAMEIRPWSFCENFKLIPDSNDGKAMRNLQYKLIRFDDGREEFYNLVLDPNENTNLLNFVLNEAELGEYTYLCTEMNLLLGVNYVCESGVGLETQNSINNTFTVYPNPFYSNLFLKGNSGNEYYELINSLGIKVFCGKNIEKHDFSNLPSGIYILKCVENPSQRFKLIKN